MKIVLLTLLILKILLLKPPVQRKKENGTWVFNCQHGPDECTINKIEACGLARNNNQDEQMEYVYCVESCAKTNRNELTKLAKCASKLGIPGSEILKCAQGPEGDELLAKLADKQDALKPRTTHVPWLIFNDQSHNSTLELQALEHFFNTACDLLSDKPEGCSELNKIPNN